MDRLAEIKAYTNEDINYHDVVLSRSYIEWLIEQVEANWRGLLESERELLDAQTRLGRMQAVVDAAREVLSHCSNADKYGQTIETVWFVNTLRKPLQELDREG